jgi:membrane protein DedA with SNARE-associated domain
MPSLQQAFDWLLALPPAALAGAGYVLAFLENVFPPLPSDSMIGFISFIAAAGDASITLTMGSIVAGSVSGAALVYVLGRRYGADELHDRMVERGLVQREEKLEQMYERYGILALFIGRLIPGVRSIVPMVAGALRLNPWSSLTVVSMASALWYGTLTYIAFKVGDNWEQYSAQLKAVGQWGAGVGLAFAAVVTFFAIRFWRKRHPPKA